MTISDDAPLTLAAEFPEPTREQWLALVAKVVRVEDPNAAEQALTTTVFGDVATKPLYVDADVEGSSTGEPGRAPFVRGRSDRGTLGGWDVRVRHDHPDVKTAREQLLEDLEGGASSVWLVVGDSGLAVDAIPGVFEEVYLDLITVALESGTQLEAASRQLLDLVDDRGFDPSSLSIRFGADPLGVAASNGIAPDLDAAVALAVRSARELPNARAFTVDALPYHLAGADAALEIGCSLAVGVEYLRAMRTAGLDADAAFGELEFRYAATADEFLTIAKLRAARRTWSQVATSCGVTGTAGGQLQHAVASPAMITTRDPWNNILRGTLAGFAAGVGGANAITITPLDAAIGYSDRLARRVARNTHALLVEESNIARTVDPAGGSWYVESLTSDIARESWAAFQEIERAGGALAALGSGYLDEAIAAQRTDQLAALAHRQVTITGVTEFPLAGEKLLAREPRPEPTGGGLPRLRWSAMYEAARDRSDRYAEKYGAPPTVTITSAAPDKASAAAAKEVQSALTSGGIDSTAVKGDDVSDVGAVAVVCRGSEAPDADVVEIVAKLRAAGAVLVIGVGSGEAVDYVIESPIDAPALHELVLAALEAAR